MQKMWIAGQMVGADEVFEVSNPFSGDVIEVVARGSAQHAQWAVDAAVKGAQAMREMPVYRRAAILNEVARLIEQESEALASLLTRENGKTIRDSRTEVARAASIFRLAAEECKYLTGEQVPFEAAANGEGRFGFWVHEPVGVVAAITPFNVPLALAAHKVAPALAAGNAVVLKPAEQTPLTSLHLAQLLYRAGVPVEAVSVITGFGEEVGQPLIENPAVNYVSFTGSRAVGQQLPKWAGAKKITLELGGNAAVIVTPTANLEEAAKAIVLGGYRLAGQLCISVQRVLAHESIQLALTEQVAAQVETLKVGDPMDEATDVGPVIDYDALQRITEWVKEAVSAGAKPVVGARSQPPFYLPTLLTETPPNARLNCEEVFGPVVSVQAYSDFEDAIAQANSTVYGLQMGIFTNDLQEAFRAARELQAGGVMINDSSAYRSDLMPYGGVKESGLSREGIRWAMEHMTNPKVVCFNGIRLG